MKKIIAFSFILIAGIILLTHDIVSHHHHETDAIEQSQTCTTNSEKEHRHTFPEHEHQQDDYLFVIRQALLLSPNPGRHLANDDDYTGINGLDYFFLHTPTFLYVYIPPDYKIPIWEKHQNIPTPVTCTFGLRAPPAIV